MVVNRAPVRRAARVSGWNRAIVAFVVGVAPALGCGGGDGGAADGGAPQTGDPATGTGGGSNLTCGHSSFSPNAALYQDISAAPVDSESATILSALEERNWGDAGDRLTLGIDFSFEINCADSSVTRRSFTQDGDNQPDCDLAPVPLPAGGKTEGADNYDCSGGDCHLIVYQGTRIYELYQANVAGGSATGAPFTGTCLAIWDLTHDYWSSANQSPNYSRGDACDGGTASDLPLAPMLLTTEELEDALAHDGIIHHALRFTLKNNRINAAAYVHPATHYGFGGTTGGADTLPTGARLRLRGDYNLAGLPSDAARVVARTLQHYGMYLVDGGNIYISATTDASAMLASSAVGALRPRDFEMVNGGRASPGTTTRAIALRSPTDAGLTQRRASAARNASMRGARRFPGTNRRIRVQEMGGPRARRPGPCHAPPMDYLRWPWSRSGSACRGSSWRASTTCSTTAWCARPAPGSSAATAGAT